MKGFWNFSFKQLKSSMGFSLMEVMISLGLSGAISLGVSQMMRDQTQVNKVNETKFNMMVSAFEIFEVLQDEASCSRTLLNVNVAGGAVATVFRVRNDGSAISAFSQGDPLGGGTVKADGTATGGSVVIESMNINNYEAGGESPNEGMVTLTVNFRPSSRQSDTGKSATRYRKTFRLPVLTTGGAGTQVVSCGKDSADMAEKICVMFNGFPGTSGGAPTCQNMTLNGDGGVAGVTLEGPLLIDGNLTTQGGVDGGLNAGQNMTIQSGNVSVNNQASAGNDININDGQDLVIIPMGGATERRVTGVNRITINGGVKLTNDSATMQEWPANLSCPGNSAMASINRTAGSTTYTISCRSPSVTSSCGGWTRHWSGPSIFSCYFSSINNWDTYDCGSNRYVQIQYVSKSCGISPFTVTYSSYSHRCCRMGMTWN